MSAVDLVRALVRSQNFPVRVVLYNNGEDCEDVLFLTRIGSQLTDFLQDKVKLLNVVNVTAI